MLLSELKVAEASGEDFDETAVVKSYAKKLRKSASEYEKLNHPEKAEELLAELKVVEEFLPAQLSASEIEALVSRLLEQNDYGPRDLGRLMKAVMGEHGDRVDGGLVQQIAARKLSERDC